MGNCQKHHDNNHESQNQKRGPHGQLQYSRKPFLSRPNSSTCTGIKERNALSDLAFHLIHIHEIALFVWVITFALSNVAVVAHSLDVGTVGAIVTTKCVMCLGITNNERQLEVHPHETFIRYPHLMPMSHLLQCKKTLNYTF